MKVTVREQRLCRLWRKLRLVVGLSGAASLVLPAGIPAAGADASPSIRVRVNNYSEASDGVVASAERQATRIFEKAGLGVVWLNCPMSRSLLVEPNPCHQAPEARDVILRILSAPTGGDSRNDVFGFAVHPLLASIYYDRVLHRAIRGDTPFDLVLGAVIAHEIGHLLIGSNGHSDLGVMQAHWARSQIRQAETGNLLFTPEQAQLIQGEAQARTELRKLIPKRRTA